MIKKLNLDFFLRKTNVVAKDLIGKIIHFDKQKILITETESYIGTEDPACHASKGLTKRTSVMFGVAGFTYVYLIYGMYYCLNIVTEEKGFPAAVLIRGGKVINEDKYLNGPGKLCKFLNINNNHNKLDITNNNYFFIADYDIYPIYQTTKRIGISKGKEKLWRHVIYK